MEVTDRDNMEDQVGDLLALIAENVGHAPSPAEVAEFCLITQPVLAGIVFTFDSGRVVSHVQVITELRRQVNDLTDQVDLLREANAEIASARVDDLVGESYMIVPERCAECGRFLSLSCSVDGEVPT